MKRQELKALLHGVENAGEIIDQIMEINGADIENAKKEKSAQVRIPKSGVFRYVTSVVNFRRSEYRKFSIEPPQ